MECSYHRPTQVAQEFLQGTSRQRLPLKQGQLQNIPLQAITTKEITLRGSFRFHSEFANGVNLMKSGLIVVDSLITHSFGIAEAKTAFETAGDRSQAMKVQISF